LIKTPERSLLSRATDSTIKLDFMKILHLSTYIMETRRNRNQMMFQMKRKSQNMKNLQKNLQKMRRYRSNVRSDAARLEKMGKKNGECKYAKRDLQRQAIQSGNTKLEKKIKMQRNT
jgi:predicted O-linked N-acetylglucosamine transferase (SPINDLY family)